MEKLLLEFVTCSNLCSFVERFTKILVDHTPGAIVHSFPTRLPLASNRGSVGYFDREAIRI